MRRGGGGAGRDEAIECVRATADTLEQTASLCDMIYWPPFWVPGVHKMEKLLIEKYSSQYRELLIGLRDEQISEEEILKLPFLNQLFNVNTIE